MRCCQCCCSYVVVVVIVIVAVVHPRNLTLKFGWNWVSKSSDIADIEFVWVGGGFIEVEVGVLTIDILPAKLIRPVWKPTQIIQNNQYQSQTINKKSSLHANASKPKQKLSENILIL